MNYDKHIHSCKCCGQTYPALPPGTWLSRISGWHRVRITHPDGPEYSSEEIGAGNDPADAVKEAWKQWKIWADRVKQEKCWYCNDAPDWWDEWDPGEGPPCEVCGLSQKKETHDE